MPDTKKKPPDDASRFGDPCKPLASHVQCTSSETKLSCKPVHSAEDDSQPVKFGELIVLGYNGHLPNGDKGRRKSKYILYRRPKANGVKPFKRHLVTCPQSSKAVQDSALHSVSYTLSRNKAIIVEYQSDEDTDMFQIGRSSENPIDYVVMDTIPGHIRNSSDNSITQSTISRFACRIIVDRNPPYTAHIIAAGFDAGRNIFLGEKAVKWYSGEEIDGLTTNGVFIMKPQGGFAAEAKPGVWREVSVGGGVFPLRESRPSPLKSCQVITDEDNMLRDGTLIDLCGATMLWRSALGLISAPSEHEFEHLIGEINAGRPQCPVGLNTLVLPTRGSLNLHDKQPYVYLSCGHVHGKHQWGVTDIESNRTCPLCLTIGPFVKLQMGCELSLYMDSEPPTYCFNPCGHVASENTVKYWAHVAVPHGCHGFRAICPFCASPLVGNPGYVKLIFQDHAD